MATAILRLPTVKARTGLSRSTIYLRVSQGTFPNRPLKNPPEAARAAATM